MLAGIVRELDEGIAEPVDLGGRYPHAGVGYREAAERTLVADADGHHPAQGREFDGIGQQVQQDLLERAAVGAEEDRCQGFAHIQFDAAGGGALGHQLDAFAHQGGGVHALAVQFELAGFDLRHVEDVADQVEKMRPSAVDQPGIVAIARVAIGTVHLGMDDFREAEHRVQRRAQFVAHIREEGGFGVARLLRHVLGQQGFLARGLGALGREREALLERAAFVQRGAGEDDREADHRVVELHDGDALRRGVMDEWGRGMVADRQVE